MPGSGNKGDRGSGNGGNAGGGGSNAGGGKGDGGSKSGGRSQNFGGSFAKSGTSSPGGFNNVTGQERMARIGDRLASASMSGFANGTSSGAAPSGIGGGFGPGQGPAAARAAQVGRDAFAARNAQASPASSTARSAPPKAKAPSLPATPPTVTFRPPAITTPTVTTAPLPALVAPAPQLSYTGTVPMGVPVSVALRDTVAPQAPTNFADQKAALAAANLAKSAPSTAAAAAAAAAQRAATSAAMASARPSAPSTPGLNSVAQSRGFAHQAAEREKGFGYGANPSPASRDTTSSGEFGVAGMSRGDLSMVGSRHDTGDPSTRGDTVGTRGDASVNSEAKGDLGAPSGQFGPRSRPGAFSDNIGNYAANMRAATNVGGFNFGAFGTTPAAETFGPRNNSLTGMPMGSLMGARSTVSKDQSRIAQKDQSRAPGGAPAGPTNRQSNTTTVAKNVMSDAEFMNRIKDAPFAGINLIGAPTSLQTTSSAIPVSPAFRDTPLAAMAPADQMVANAIAKAGLAATKQAVARNMRKSGFSEVAIADTMAELNDFAAAVAAVAAPQSSAIASPQATPSFLGSMASLFGVQRPATFGRMGFDGEAPSSNVEDRRGRN